MSSEFVPEKLNGIQRSIFKDSGNEEPTPGQEIVASCGEQSAVYRVTAVTKDWIKIEFVKIKRTGFIV